MSSSTATRPPAADRRGYARHQVFAGNAEVTAVIGRGRRPGERARILNWSRGGVLLKVRSPRRRLVFLKQDPCLREQDSIACTLRLPPLYSDIDIQAQVVRVERIRGEPEYLHVGLRFDPEATPPERLESLARLLEPRAKASSFSGRLRRPSARISGRIASTRHAVPTAGRRPSGSAREPVEPGGSTSSWSSRRMSAGS